jgi:predicted FMN-binding regulatory protein PaiB
MPAIVGFEIKADHMENVFKLSQNRDEASYNEYYFETGRNRWE